MALTETSSASKAISAYPELSVKNEHLNEDGTFRDEHSVSSSPVKIMVSPNYFSMKGPWLEHALDFHSMKNKGSSLLGTAERFEFQSRTLIADAIKVVSAYSSRTELDNFLYAKNSRQAKKRKNASVQVNFDNMPPTPVPERRTIGATSVEKPPIGRPKLKLPSKGSTNIVKNWRNVDKNEENIPKDVWKHFRHEYRYNARWSFCIFI